MRIWLDPHKLNSYGLMMSELQLKLKMHKLQQVSFTDSWRTGFKCNSNCIIPTVNQFENIILRTQTNGAVLKMWLV